MTTTPAASPGSTFRLSPQQGCLLSAPTPLVSQCAIVVEGEEPALRAALDELVATHEILRSTFPTPPGARVPVGQVVHEKLLPAWATAPMGDGDLTDLLRAEAAALAAPDAGPPLRVTSRPEAGGRQLLVLTALAAAADVQSLIEIAITIAGPLAGKDMAIAGQQAGDEEPLQHADYAEWRAELIAGDDAEAVRGREFWAEAVDATAAAPSFPLATAPAGMTALVEVPFAPAQDAITAVAEALGADASLVVEAAWATLLTRILGSEELLLAAMADGRAIPDLAGAIGPYAQAVPVIVRVGPETRFAEVVDQVRRGRAEGARRQDYGSETQLRLLLDRAAAGFAALPNGAPGVLALRSAVPGTRLGLAWSNVQGGGLWAAPDLTGPTGLSEVSDWLTTMLTAAAADPAAVAHGLTLLEGDARARAIALGAGEDGLDATVPVHRAFEAQVAKTPDAPAVVAPDGILSYAGLNERADRLAVEIAAAGIAPGAPVGLCLPRTSELLVALLAVLKSGSPYVPLNLAHPADRVELQLAEAGAELLVSESGLTRRAPASAAAVPDAGELAYIMFTSGSTGTPKGVAVTHANLAAYTAAVAERIGAAPGLAFASVSEVSTDLGNTAIFTPLTTGGVVHLIDAETAMDGNALAARAATQPIDVIKITPTHLRALLDADAGVLPRRWLIVGGEAFSWDLLDRIRAAGAPCRILNHYGPTETTVGCCTFEVPADDASIRSTSATVPIGRPLAGERVYVLDAHLEPQPPGVPGELCVAGAGVARGYVGRAEETAKRFVPSMDGDGRMYRTGDRVRFLASGDVEFLGRVDDQIKIRGFRVEPAEIEARLASHPGVRHAAVVAWPHPADGELSLIAYVVGSPAPEAAELLAFLGQTLPEHMIPTRFIAVEAMPLTPSGKVDRRALPDPAEVEAERTASFVAPRDELEQQIADIWCELLGIREVGVMDDFFALGGHSLLATQAIMRVRRRYGNVPLAAMFNAPTIASLADAIRARLSDQRA
jgi:amino acid adenylation domain-containing protein